MEGFRRRTLRTWAVLDFVYAVLLAGTMTAVVPWKTPGANVFGLVYALAVATSAPGLWFERRWAHRLALATSLVGLGLAVLVIAGLVASWAYLRAVYGAFGFGGSVVALVVAALVFQVLGLYPSLRLRALLRREVRDGFGGGNAATVTTAALVVVPLLAALGLGARHGLATAAPLPDEALGPALAVVRACAEGRAPEAPHLDALARVTPAPLHLFATLWREGRAVARAGAIGATLAEAARSAGDALRTVAPAGATREARLKLDRVVGDGPVLSTFPAVLALSLAPGLDGLWVNGGGAAVLPDDVLVARAVGAAPLVPAPGLEEIRLGVDVGFLGRALGRRLDGARRFRTEGWIEGHPGPQRVHRGRVLSPAPSPQVAARAAGEFLLRSILPDGRFVYRYDPVTNAVLPEGAYSLPRHAGTIYSLSHLHAATKDPRYADAAEQALVWLEGRIGSCGGERACVLDAPEPRLGASALALIAVLEHARATGDRRRHELARRLAALLLALQSPDGELAHSWDRASDAPRPIPKQMFASEEAALALVLAHEALGDPAYLVAAERALDYLTERKYAFFLGRFVYGADAWTCIAADEVWPRLKKPSYLSFCRGYAAFLHRLQYEAAPGKPWFDFAGHYGVSYLLVPQAPAAAGFSEAVVSTFRLARKHGADAEDLRAQAEAALGALARDQIRPEDAYYFAAPARAAGGIRRSLVEPEIRIDFVQHAASALVRGAALGLEAR